MKLSSQLHQGFVVACFGCIALHEHIDGGQLFFNYIKGFRSSIYLIYLVCMLSCCASSKVCLLLLAEELFLVVNVIIDMADKLLDNDNVLEIE